MSLDVVADGNEHRTAGDAQNAHNAEKGQVLETENERKLRIMSLRVVYFTMFLMTLGFSIILTGIWPYLDKVNINHHPFKKQLRLVNCDIKFYWTLD